MTVNCGKFFCNAANPSKQLDIGSLSCGERTAARVPQGDRHRQAIIHGDADSMIQRFIASKKKIKRRSKMKHVNRIKTLSVLSLVAFTFATPSASPRAAASALAPAGPAQLAGPALPAPKLPKNPPPAPSGLRTRLTVA
jgi:hypothetical protein